MTSPSPAPSLPGRLARRSLDLLVVAFLISVGLSTGSQLVDWWRTDPRELTPDLSDLVDIDVDWNRTPVTLRFGDATTSLQRIPFEGRRQQLDEELIRIGQSIVKTSRPVASPADQAELDWLTTLEQLAPVFWDSTDGNVYRRDEPLPSFVATRLAEPDSSDKAEVAVRQRIVGWGLAFPTAPAAWTIYVFHPDTSGATPQELAAAGNLPPGARNVTTLQGTNGCEWSVIQGRGDLAGWVQHFDGRFGADHAITRDVTPKFASLKYRNDKSVADVQLRTETDGRLTGVIWSAREREKQ